MQMRESIRCLNIELLRTIIWTNFQRTSRYSILCLLIAIRNSISLQWEWGMTKMPMKTHSMKQKTEDRSMRGAHTHNASTQSNRFHCVSALRSSAARWRCSIYMKTINKTTHSAYALTLSTVLFFASSPSSSLCCGTNRWIFAPLRFSYCYSKRAIKFIIEWFNVLKWSVSVLPGAVRFIFTFNIRIHTRKRVCIL